MEMVKKNGNLSVVQKWPKLPVSFNILFMLDTTQKGQELFDTVDQECTKIELQLNTDWRKEKSVMFHMEASPSYKNNG